MLTSHISLAGYPTYFLRYNFYNTSAHYDFLTNYSTRAVLAIYYYFDDISYPEAQQQLRVATNKFDKSAFYQKILQRHLDILLSDKIQSKR
jgi:hypothetical protein